MIPWRQRLLAFEESAEIGHDFPWQLSAGEAATVEKIVTVYTGRDVATSEPGVEAQRCLRTTRTVSEPLDGHVTDWEHLWERCPSSSTT